MGEFASEQVGLHHGDCLNILPTLAENSVDTCLTDPPYGLSFMGKGWDHGVPGEPFWRAVWRVLKPGAILFAFGGTRTFHRLACAIEDAGFEIRDTMMWVYGSGFPKSHDISKAIDKAAGAEREVVGTRKSEGGRTSQPNTEGIDPCKLIAVTTPATEAAAEWDGWGTALKPAWEPIIVAMKPLDGTFAENAQRWGVAGLWIDGGRVEAPSWSKKDGGNGSGFSKDKFMGNQGKGEPSRKNGLRFSAQGRWPANVLHDGSDEVVAGFPVTMSNSGNLTHSNRNNPNGMYGQYGAGPTKGISDTGSAARFFYCAKASKAERTNNGTIGNRHPTVKPLALLRYLARLTKTPTGGVVLDPFMGSGSTGVACIQEGRDFIGIEMEAESYETARQRIEAAEMEPVQLSLAVE